MLSIGLVVSGVGGSSKSNHTTSPVADASVTGEPILMDGTSRLSGLATVRSFSASGLVLASMSVSTKGTRSPEFHVSSGTSSARFAKKCDTTPDIAPGSLKSTSKLLLRSASSLTTRLALWSEAQLMNWLLLDPSSTNAITKLSSVKMSVAAAPSLPALGRQAPSAPTTR